MYNKIFTKILDSSIWMEPMATRIVWLTFLAAMDEDGFVEFASPANVAHRAIAPLDATLVALAALEGPDEDSSDPENGGRRIERVPGGWVVLNAVKYRGIVTRAVRQDRTRERVKAHRARHAKVTPCHGDVTACNADVTPRNVPVTQSVSVSVSTSVSKAHTRDADAEHDGVCSPSILPLTTGPIADRDQWRMHEALQPWAKALKAALCKIGPENWTAWKGLADEFPIAVVLSAAKGVPATERWPDRVEQTLRASRGQENPGDVIAHKIRKITL